MKRTAKQQQQRQLLKEHLIDEIGSARKTSVLQIQNTDGEDMKKCKHTHTHTNIRFYLHFRFSLHSLENQWP